jgi:hypothetical protein
MPLQETSGNVTSDAYGGGAAVIPYYIEDMFSTWLYTGTSTTNPIVNNIDLSTKGGMVWIKNRNLAASDHNLTDTARGVNAQISSNSTAASGNYNAFTSFNTNGFTVRSTDNYVNNSSYNYISWTFRKQPKFFDVVTYTGNGVAGRTVPHNLGSVPGCIIIKRTDASADWIVYHRSLGATKYLVLNFANAAGTSTNIFNDTAPTSTVFSVGIVSGNNASGGSYVAYVFAHDSGGFGLTGTDNVISCGSFTTDASGNATVNLGYEPQYALVKASSTSGAWVELNTMSGWGYVSTNTLEANTSNGETNQGANTSYPLATGMQIGASAGTIMPANATCVYIAIRKGPMKVPTDATKVYKAISRAGNDISPTTISGVGFTPDASLIKTSNSTRNFDLNDRLRGNLYLRTAATDTENNAGFAFPANPIWDVQQGIKVGAGSDTNNSSYNYINYFFGRAPKFFDEVCYTGNNSTENYTHNLNAVPELIIVKCRSTGGTGTYGWWTLAGANNFATAKQLTLNTTDASASPSVFSAAPTSTQFYVLNYPGVNEAGKTYVAYLFATCAGVSKVGSYTGTGSTQTISCGFTGGARFVLIKRTDSTGDWYVWDTARGMVSGTDPSLLLNSTAAEVNANSIYTTTGGFQIVSTAAGINASGGNYIFLAIA